VKSDGSEANAGIFTAGTPAVSIGSLNPAISSDGRYVAFDSTSTDMTPAFVDSFTNIFVKDRVTGAIVEITSVVSGEFGPFINNCTMPAISGDGKVVAFLSKGIYTPSLGGGTNVNVWVYDIPSKTFSCGTVDGINFPNADCSGLALSDDGQFLTFSTAATNILSSAKSAPATTFANPSAGTQVYVTNLKAANTVPAIQLMSPAMGTTTGATGDSSSPSISGDGSLVAFSSSATNLVAGPPASGAYTSKVGSASVKLVSVGLIPGTSTIVAGNGTCFNTALSTDGSFVAFSASHINNWGPAVNLGVFRYDSNTGLAQVVAPDMQSKFGFILVPDLFGFSGDGQMVAYMRSQLTVRNLLTGSVQNASVNISGSGANFQCFSPALSEDGRWTVWHTLSTNLIAGDNNGSNDIYVRGPLR
jgi:Tol biopolymer transport system component